MGDMVAGRFRISGDPKRAAGVLLCGAAEIASGASVRLAVCANLATVANAEFFAKAKRISALSHANIASVREILLEGDRPVAVCDAPTGVDLWAWRRAHGRAPTATEFDRIAGQLLDAVSALHAAGALHLCVTPGAITIGADGRATLAPFGAPSDAPEADGFCPPELVAGSSASAGERSDVFGCAATLTALISGSPPSNAGGLPAPVTAAGSDIRPEALQALAISLSSDPADRPPSAHALAALLFDFSSDASRALSAATPSASVKPPPRSPTQRSRGTATWSALAALAVLLLAGLYALDFSPPWQEMARRARSAPPESAPRAGETAPAAPVAPTGRIEEPKPPSLPPKADSVEKPEAKAPPEPRKDATAVRLTEIASMTNRDTLAGLAKDGTPASQAAKARLEALGYVLARGGVTPVWLKPGEGDVFRDCAECPEVVLLPAGEFLMGSPSDEPGRNDDEDDTPGQGGSPVAITIAQPFAVSRTEITRGEFAAFAADTKRSSDGGCFARSGALKLDSALSWRDPGFPQDDRHPVVCINYDDARAYAEWLSKRAGARYRLPSEAEWEYAARGGASVGARTFFGDGAEDLCSYANGADATAREHNPDWVVAPCRDGFAWTAPVGSFRPNGFGLRDMLGNVWEWTSDCASDSLSQAARGGPPDCAPDANRILRGGSWSDPPDRLRLAARIAGPSAARDQIVGFRLVREIAR
jgi:formylglycine-generating enzyme required for sulfatase activity/serine/threonine protein kinase